MSRRKGKRKGAGSSQELVTVEAPTPAERHTFSAGILGHDLTGSPWVVNVSELTALGIDAFYACVRIIADAMSGARIGEWTGTTQLPTSRLVRRPMATMTRREWMWRVAATLAVYNYCYIQEVGGRSPIDGLPMSLRPLVPTRVAWAGPNSVTVDGQPVDPSSLRVWRRAYWPSVTAEIGTILTFARETFAAAMASDAYRSDFWQQGGAPVVVLTTDQVIDNTVADGIADRWVEKRVTSPGKPAVLSHGAKAAPLGADLGTAGANESGDKLRASVARYMGMPPDMINVASEAGSLTYSTPEAANLQLVRYTLGAYADTIGDGFGEILPGDPMLERAVRLDLSTLTMAEQLARFSAWTIALDAPGHPGWMTAQEIRAAEGMPPDLALPSSGLPAPAIESIPVATRDVDELRRIDLGGTFAVRDAEAGDGRTIEGIAVPYGETIRGGTREYGLAIESFAPGAFRDAIADVERGQRIPIIDRHEGDVVGYADRLWDSPEGLRYAGRLLDVAAARDFGARVLERVMRVSIEFLPGEIRRAAHAVTHTRVRALGAIAGSYAPAYAGATASIRDIGGSPVMHCEHCGAEILNNTPCQCAGAVAARDAVARRDALAAARVGVVDITPESVAALASSAAEEYMRAWSERNMGGLQTPEDPFADLRGYRTLGHLVQAAIAVDAPVELRAWGARALAARALADQLTTDSNAGVLTPGVLTEVHGIVSRGRPAITAFGGPRPLLGTGMSVDWPYFDGTLSSLIGAQATEKTEITTAKVQIKKGTEPIQTFAGGSDISYQLLRRSTPSYLEVYTRILLTAYGVVTDAAFVTELESGSVTGDFAEALSTLDSTELKNLLIDAAIAVQTATGVPAEFVLASTTAFTAAAKLLTPVTSQPAQAGIGVVDLANLRVNIGNLPIIHVPSITAGKFIASNREAAAWFEDGPFQATDEDVAKLGRNVAIWGMGAPARFIPAGIIEIYDVTP